MCRPAGTTGEGGIGALSPWWEGFIEKVGEMRWVLKDEFKFAGWCGRCRGGKGRGWVQWAPPGGSDSTQGKDASPGLYGTSPSCRLSGCGSHGVFPGCQPGQSPIGQSPGGVTWGGTLRRGLSGRPQPPPRSPPPLRTGCFSSGLATHSSAESTRIWRNAAFTEFLAVNTN